MSVQAEIKKREQQVARLGRNLSMQKIKQRKAETRRKIQFGGLVVKAKMDEFPKDVILGALIHAKENIERELGTLALFKSKGETAFMEYGDN